MVLELRIVDLAEESTSMPTWEVPPVTITRSVAVQDGVD
jgi:hypothetical protein